MSKKVIYFDGGGSGIRAGANIDGTKSEAKNFAGFSHGEVDLVDYLADVVSKYANEIGGDISRAVLATATLPADAARYDAIASLVFQNPEQFLQLQRFLQMPRAMMRLRALSFKKAISRSSGFVVIR